MRVAEVLSPYFGSQTADTVARHLCASHGIGEEPTDPEALSSLQETIREGLASLFGPERAEELARRCR